MEVVYLLNLFSLGSVFIFAAWLIFFVFKTSSPPTRRTSRTRRSIDASGSPVAGLSSSLTAPTYLDTNLEVVHYYQEEESEGEDDDDFQSVHSDSRRVSFADKLFELSSQNYTGERRRMSCIDLKDRKSSFTGPINGLRKRGKLSRSESDPGNKNQENFARLPPLIAVTPCDELSFAEEMGVSVDNIGGINGDQYGGRLHGSCSGNNEMDTNPPIVEDFLHQHTMPRKLSDQRRGSFLYRSEADSSSRGLSRTSSMSSMNDKNGLDDVIVTPFAQILARLKDVKGMMSRLTNLPADEADESRNGNRFSGVEQQQMLLDGLGDIEWVLEHLNKIKARNSVGEMAQSKFKRMLTRELSQFSETSRSGGQVAEWVSNTYFDKDDDELDIIEKTKARIPTVYTKRIINQAQQALKGNFPKYGVEVEDEDAMSHMVSQINLWNFDMFKFSTISKDHPLVALSYIVLQQERGLLRAFNVDVHTFIKYMFVIEANYHKTNPYHNAVHGADVMQACHVLLSYPVVEQVFTDLEVFAALFASAIHDVDHPGLSNQFLSTTSNELAILYNDHAVLENHHLATAFKFLQEDELNWANEMPVKQKSLLRKMVIDLVLATDMSKHLSLMSDIKTTVESSKVAHNGKLVLESYNERMLVLQGIVHSCDISSATKALPIYRAWTEKIIEEFYQQGDRERELGLSISPMCDRNNPSIEKSQVGFIDFIVLPLWETLGELMFPFCQEMLNQLNENRNYYFCRIPESPRCSLSDPPSEQDRNNLNTVSEKRKNSRSGITGNGGKLAPAAAADGTGEVSDLSSIEEESFASDSP